LYLTGLRRFIW